MKCVSYAVSAVYGCRPLRWESVKSVTGQYLGQKRAGLSCAASSELKSSEKQVQSALTLSRAGGGYSRHAASVDTAQVVNVVNPRS
jgi:hypothetical protein